MRNSPRSAILLLRVIRVLHSLRNGDRGNKPTSRCPRCFCSQTAGRRAPLPAPPPARRPAPCALGPALAAARMSQNPPRFPCAVRLEPRHPPPHPRPASTARGTHGPACPSGTAQGFLSGGRAGPAGWGAPRCVLAAPASPTQLTSRPTAPGFLVCSHRRPGLCSVQPNPSTWEVLDERSLGAVGRALV